MKSALIASILTLIVSVPNAVKTTQEETWNKNKVIAHRGAWKKAGLPENSIASLKEAIRLGCYGTEFDVHMTADGILVINHDADFLGLTISKSTYKELLTKKHTNGESIPTLEDYLKEGIKQQGTKLILEIKPSSLGLDWDLKMTQKSVEMVKKLKAKSWVDYISFSYDILKKVRVLDAKAKVSYLKGDIAPEKLKEDGFYGPDYHYNVYLNDKGMAINRFKDLGLKINVWTVNDRSEMLMMLENQVDFITTNEPELLLSLNPTH
ncbi:glycerophosphodiester phosphodiesterase [Pedobacter metabolipauper]|uniref:Glycerophosphoryl diester phosphodiesterase n=1 Tax=Pedobacter metabolipauper TaxID=425513 RepID=A0A4R6SWQ6_9SPHI|nr:glycerophosphodiester phosphodiesterase family protein [Pedobacter metabolipauper]TDQ09573.1 glycerophosphoryl diester phosphodiesterase [Pedobacter metabolipauper]